ncbi:hypothetical protein EGR_10006 [Echinococcus granulosus]|uniref:Uncharacterized protein n=1 Tax=Echinococcus granulosus TaxID=6210 RepID=W6U3J9_ECHGR|nr:hypothetical protein EGR_10006 [Echinococcus granulosus]EUB55146.1 hypothetical protein EGR_10006 [Echinococcus granulosus]
MELQHVSTKKRKDQVLQNAMELTIQSSLANFATNKHTETLNRSARPIPYAKLEGHFNVMIYAQDPSIIRNGENQCRMIGSSLAHRRTEKHKWRNN